MSGKKVVFRADASCAIGSGHVMRCLTLADILASLEYDIHFICRNLPGHMMQYIVQRGYTVYSLGAPTREDTQQTSEDAVWINHVLQNEFGAVDWLVVDHYGIDAVWERVVRSYAKRVMVIDDLADRKHDCDILLDQNYYIDGPARYRNLVPHKTLKLLGPKYALLRPEFLDARRRACIRDCKLRRVFVSFGGSDPVNATSVAIQALQPIAGAANFSVDVVVGINNPRRDEIRQFCLEHEHHLKYHCQISNMSQLMLQADLAIGAGGVTTLERCFLGLPSITLIIAQNQVETTEAVASAGATLNLGWVNQMSSKLLSESLNEIIVRPKLLGQMSAAALRLMCNTPVSADEVRDMYRHVLSEF
jgi:UDP-2,4-diacetamido-2,4,6-trideoxy-beta-L-altropyranose hydrolase